MKTLCNALSQSHMYIKKVVEKGAIVVDATMGNGNDTEFLAELVGCEGKVYSFDIQSKAIEKTKERVSKYLKIVELINDGHQNMDKYMSVEIDACMFNLGYLPGGDHNIKTRFETTKQAIEKALGLLKQNGLITIVVYHGGDSGFEEKEKLMDFFCSLDSKKYTVMKTEFFNQINCPPVFVCVEKIY